MSESVCDATDVFCEGEKREDLFPAAFFSLFASKIVSQKRESNMTYDHEWLMKLTN